MRAPLVLAVALGLIAGPALAGKKPRWETLPLPPAMPEASRTGFVEHAGAKIYYATYGKQDGPPVLLLHGGMGNGDHFAHQVPALADRFRVVVVDSRGQGRSTLPKDQIGGKLSYHAMAGDVVAVMDKLAIDRAALVGWSDGGSIALDLAIHQPDRVAKLFVIGTNYDARGSKPRKGKPPAPTFAAYTARCRADHARLGGKPRDFQAAVAALLPVWRDPAGFTKDQLRSIRAPALLAVGAHDEIIRRDHVEEMARLIPRGSFRLFADTSHFTLWQDPKAFNAALVAFLTAKSE